MVQVFSARVSATNVTYESKKALYRLRHDSDTATGTACDTVPMGEQKSPATHRGHVGLYRRHAWEVDSILTSQACRR